MTASTTTRVVRLRSVLLTSPSACLALSLAWGRIDLARSMGPASMVGIRGSDVGGGAGVCVAVGSGVGVSVGF